MIPYVEEEFFVRIISPSEYLALSKNKKREILIANYMEINESFINDMMEFEYATQEKSLTKSGESLLEDIAKRCV